MAASARKGLVQGDTEQGSVMSGQVAGLINDEPTCAELIQRVMKEFYQAVGRLRALEII